MSTVKQLHHEAMRLAETAREMLRTGDPSGAGERYRLAYEKEIEAAHVAHLEPTRGILHRSAGWLAIKGDLPAEALRAAAAGLASAKLHSDVYDDLVEVFEEAQLALSLHSGIPVPDSAPAFEVHLRGHGIGYGSAPPREVSKRVDLMETMLYRSAECVAGDPFRRGKGPKPEYRKMMQPRVRFTDGSLGIRIEVGGSQLSAFDQQADQAVAKILDGFRVLSTSDEHGMSAEALSNVFNTADYRENFFELARRLAPDGDTVTKVAIGGTHHGRSTVLSLAQPITRRREHADEPQKTRVFVGTLRGADGTGNKDTIKLVPEKGKTVSVEVSQAALEDIVRPHFGSPVRVEVLETKRRGKKRYVLKSIDDAD